MQPHNKPVKENAAGTLCHSSYNLGTSAQNPYESAELRCTFCDGEFRRIFFFPAEVLGITIESAEVHYTKPEDEFRWGIGVNTKFRRFFFQQKSGTQFV